MNIDAQDLIAAIEAQRNDALRNAAMQAAYAAGLKRMVDELQKRLDEKGAGDANSTTTA
jgi:hypothetical protein